MLGCANQRTWEKLCHEVIGKPEWIVDPRFKTNSDRGANVEALEALLEEVFQTEDRTHWLQKCEAAGVPAGPINNFNDVVQDPHYLARGMIEEVEHTVIGKMKMFGIPTKFSATPGQIKIPAPLFGQHTDEVLSSTLGLTDEKLTELRCQGIIK
jgi:crotonobetainyl-CoA:carnitine CoA-transferase CaiB-like acyl-CoA transferase